jgi:hypothetical protein
MTQWREAARRGELSADVVTKAKGLEDNTPLPDGVEFLGIVKPDDGDAFAITWSSFERLATFLRELRPHDLRLVHSRTEDGPALLAALKEFAGGLDSVQ